MLIVRLLMFANPLYHLFIRREIKEKFDVTSSTFADRDERSYLVIRDKITENAVVQHIQLQGVTYQVIDSHLTVPQMQDRQEGFFSAYHHTLYLRDDKKNNFVIHVYFDRFDTYCTHPGACIKSKPSTDTTANSALIALNNEEIITIFSRFIVHTTSKIQFVRTQQRKIISNLREMLTRTQKSISPELEGSLDHLSNLELQINILKNIETYELPSSNDFNGKKDADGFMIPNTQKHRLELERIVRQFPTKTQVPLPNVDDTQEEQRTIHTEDLAETRASQRKAQFETQQQEEKKQYHDFVAQYRQCLDEFIQANQKQERRALRSLCDLEKQAPSYQEAQQVDHEELLSLRFKGLQSLKEYCNTLDSTSYRGKADVLLQLNLDHYLTEETVSTLAIRSIIDGDTRILTILLARFALPILQQYTNPTLPVTETVANTPQYTLLEWCVKLNQPKCFGLLLKNGHRLEYFYQANSPVREILCDPLDGEEFIKELIPNVNSSMSANTKQTLIKKELAILQQQMDDARSNTNLEQLTQLKRRMFLMNVFITQGERIKNALRTVPPSIAQSASQQFLTMGCSGARNIPVEVRTQLRQDENYLKLVVENLQTSADLLVLLAGHGGRNSSLKTVLMSANQIIKTTDLGDIQLTKEMIISATQFSTAQVRLLIEYHSKIQSFAKNGSPMFAKQRDLDAYNLSFNALQENHTRSIQGSFTRSLEQQLTSLLGSLESFESLGSLIESSLGGLVRLTEETTDHEERTTFTQSSSF